MPFIKAGTCVEVRPGHRLAERFGVVREIRIIEETSAVMIFADIFNPESADMELMLFQPGEIMRRKKRPTTATRTDDEAQGAIVARVAA